MNLQPVMLQAIRDLILARLLTLPKTQNHQLQVSSLFQSQNKQRTQSCWFKVTYNFYSLQHDQKHIPVYKTKPVQYCNTSQPVLFYWGRTLKLFFIDYVILNSRERNICLSFCHYFFPDWGYFKDIEKCILRVVFKEMTKSKVDGKYFIFIVMCSIFTQILLQAFMVM